MAATDSDTQPSGISHGGVVGFLLARIAEDEERAEFVRREAERSPFEPFEPWRLTWQDEYDLLCIEPVRALAECQAKRAVIEDWVALDVDNEDMRSLDHSHEYRYGVITTLLDTLRRLAAVYADHPDYQPAWRP